MTMLSNRIIYLCTNVMFIYLIYDFVQAFLGSKLYSKTLRFSFCVVYFATISVVYLLFAISILNLVTNILLIFAMTFFFRASLKNRILVAVFAIVLGILAEFFAGFILSILYQNYFLDSEKLMLYTNIAGKIIQYVLMKIAVAVFKQEANENVSLNYWLSILFIPSGSIFVLMTIGQLGANDIGTEMSVLVAVSVVLLMGLNIFVFYIYDKILHEYKVRTDNLLLTRQVEYYDREFKDSQQRQLEIRKLAHDINNHLISIAGFAEQKDCDGIQSYIVNLEKDFEPGRSAVHTGNIVIDSIVNYKYKMALDRQIDVSADLSVPIDLALNSKDMCVLLGNLLDNALEACDHVPVPERRMDLLLKYKTGNLFIRITNSYNSQLSAKEGKTSKVDSQNHGYGLINIQNIVSKYNGSFEIDKTENTYRVDVVLYNVNEP